MAWPFGGEAHELGNVRLDVERGVGIPVLDGQIFSVNCLRTVQHNAVVVGRIVAFPQRPIWLDVNV